MLILTLAAVLSAGAGLVGAQAQDTTRFQVETSETLAGLAEELNAIGTELTSELGEVEAALVTQG